MDENKIKKLPPFTAALTHHAIKKQYPFDTPGHHGGEFYNLTEEGKIFTQFWGNSMFEGDVSDSDAGLGDPSSHEGLAGMAEKLAAETFHADKTWFVLHGTSVSNRICCDALLSPGDLVLFDRNNHKSMYQGALLQSDVTPVYLETVRFRGGIIGGLSSKGLQRKTLREKAGQINPAKMKKKHPYRLACLQLATYDGFIADARYFIDLLSPLCDYILFDAAWAGYESFIPLLESFSPLTQPLKKSHAGILVTQSVHKQLAGFSQTSQIHKKDHHIKHKKQYLPDDVLDNSFLMHISTSPYFPLFASLEMNACIHKKQGKELWEKALRFGIETRKEIMRHCRSVQPLLPGNIDGRPWDSYDTENIMTDRRFWNYRQMSKEMGARNISPHYLIDPCKILLTTHLGEKKIPAALLSMYLQNRHITPEKCGLHSILFLAQPGDTKEKADCLITALRQFETECMDKPVKEIFPCLSRTYDMTVGELCTSIEKLLDTYNAGNLEEKMFVLSDKTTGISGKTATDCFVKGERKLISLKQLKGRIALECAMVYPPGICGVAAGEKWTGTAVSYFTFIEEYINVFPDFAPECVGLHIKEKKGRKKLYAWVLPKKKGLLNRQR